MMACAIGRAEHDDNGLRDRKRLVQMANGVEFQLLLLEVDVELTQAIRRPFGVSTSATLFPVKCVITSTCCATKHC